jgi:protein-disulfide isomerase
MIKRALLILTLSLATSPAYAQQFGKAEFPIKADDGDPISNHSLTAEQMTQVTRLPGIVNVGNASGDVTLYQFYDLNCPFCREAAQDVDALMRGDRALRLVFVPYPVLSVASVEGARVELAVREIATPQKFLDLHRRIYAGRGLINGARMLAAAQDLGLDPKQIIPVANAQSVTDTMMAHSQLGSALRLIATPAYVIQGVAILGHPGLEPLQRLIASVRACGKVVC